MFNVCTIEEAKRLISEKLNTYPLEIEEVTILDAVGRYLAHDVSSLIDVPHFNRSTVDGYAVLSKETVGASESLPALFNITGQVIMGSPCESCVTPGNAIYVPTGGMLPESADGVVMIEDTETIGDELFVYTKIAPKENVLFKGEDITVGNVVLPKGKKILPQDLGVLSSIGYERVKVYKKIKYTVISTGDEIVGPGVIPQVGEIRDINSYTITGEILARNSEVVLMSVIKDNHQLLKETILKGLEISDIIILSGGSSVGLKDLTYNILEEIEPSSVFVHGIAIKPGKPTLLAKLKEKLVFGLPGQPASALIVFRTFISHIEKVMLNTSEESLFYIEATLTKNVHSAPGREMYQMVKLSKSEDGYIAEPIYGKSGTITLIADANGYIIIPSSCEGLQRLEKVKVYEL